MTTTARPPLAIAKVSPAKLASYFEAKLSAELGPHNVKRLLDLGERALVILDVRSREGYERGHVPSAVSIPFEELLNRMRQLPKSKEIICYCWDVTCTLSTKAAYMLAKQGYRAKEMVGGIAAWEQAGFSIEK